MTETQFLSHVYSKIRSGMPVEKPKKLSKIINITTSGNIYYLIGTSNKKAVTKADLIAIYKKLAANKLTNKTIAVIAGNARPCNVTTIQWILRELKLASEGPDGVWQRKW